MKKNRLSIIVCLCASVVFAFACGCTVNDEPNGSPPVTEAPPDEGGETTVPDPENTCLVTFVQAGYADVVVAVTKGGTLTDIPAPQYHKGHNVVWNRTDFSNITEDITVTSTATPKTYTITYDPNGGAIVGGTLTQEVTFGEYVTLYTATHEEAEFLEWTYNGEAVADGVWDIDDDNATIVATWNWSEYH